MKTVVIAAGRGVRLLPITYTKPKPLIPVLCKPVLHWHMEALSRIKGIDEVRVVVSYMKERVVETLSKAKPSAKLTFIDQGVEMGTGDAVIKAVNGLDPMEDVLVVYGDVFLENTGVIEEIASVDENAIAVAKVHDPTRFGVVVAENGYLKDLVEKPRTFVSNKVFAGILKVKAKDVLENRDVGLSPRGEIELTDLILRVGRRKPIRVVEIEGSWIDLGYPWSVIEANKVALKKIKATVKGVVESCVTIYGDVYVGEGARIRSGSYIEGPVYIDDNVEIGPNARIRPYSVICRGSKIGFSVEVKESVIMENVHIAHLSYVGDSVICENVNFGAGTVVANLRFDEKTVKMMVKDELIDSGRRKLGAIVGAHVKTGINVSIMPGVKIGPYSWIAPSSIVSRDVPPKVFYRTKVDYEVVNLDEYHRSKGHP